MQKENKSCKDCMWLDEYFGDCCHPKSGGCLDLQWSLNECGKERKFKEMRKIEDK